MARCGYRVVWGWLIGVACATYGHPASALEAAEVAGSNAAKADVGAGSDDGSPPREALPIRSREDLDRHLDARSAITVDGGRALGLFMMLPERARKRFIDSLEFQPPHGLVQRDFWPLQRELTQAQASELLALFGMQEHVAYLPGWRPEKSVAGADPLAEQPEPTRFETGFDRLRALERTDGWWDKRSRERVALMRQQLREHLGDDPLAIQPAGLSDSELDWLWEAISYMSFYATDEHYTRATVAAFDELTRRKLVLPRHAINTFQNLIGVRRFSDAASLADRYPGLALEKVPQVVAAPPDPAMRGGGVVVYRPQGEAAMIAERVDPMRGVHLVGMVNPSCGFSRRALDYLVAHPTVLDGIPATWIDAIASRLDRDTLDAWNRDHPALAIRIPHAASDWSFIEEVRWTPQFFLLEDGVVIDQFFGWVDGSEARLAQLLERARGVEAPADARDP